MVRGGLTVSAPTEKVDATPLPAVSEGVVASLGGESGDVLGASAISGDAEYADEEEYYLDRSPRDQRAIKLEKYLKAHNSPMYVAADTIIEQSDKYGVDYKLVVAIAYHESGLGRKCWAPFNAWGWMTKDRWSSWDEGARKYIQGLYKGYYAKGADTIEEIAPRYVMTDAWPEFVVDIKRLMSEIP